MERKIEPPEMERDKLRLEFIKANAARTRRSLKPLPNPGRLVRKGWAGIRDVSEIEQLRYEIEHYRSMLKEG